MDCKSTNETNEERSDETNEIQTPKETPKLVHYQCYPTTPYIDPYYTFYYTDYNIYLQHYYTTQLLMSYKYELHQQKLLIAHLLKKLSQKN